MGANFSRLKTWSSTEDVTSVDINAEFDNILTNLTPSGIDDYSANTAQMRSTVDPGESGTESLATSMAGELERIRYVIKEMKGADAAQWYTTVSKTLSQVEALTTTSYNYVNFITAAATNTINGPTISANTLLVGLVIKTTTAFTGLTTYVLDVGITGQTDRYVVAFDLMATVADSNYIFAQVNEMFYSSTTLKLTVTSTGGNLNLATAGALTVTPITRGLP